jgi:alkanesulfonate monooxygenase
MNIPMRDALEVFSTCPPSSQAADFRSYRRRVADVARWSEQCGCRGILVYSDNSQVDPWVLSQEIVDNTTALCPLVAVQPVYMHPYTVAKMVASFGALHDRRLYLNMVAGGFKNDLTALGDATPHDRRYDRLVEYTLIVRRLLENGGPVTLRGEFYQVDKLKLTPPLRSGLLPGVFISGSSDAGLAAARAIGATAIKYPKPADEEARPSQGSACGIRVGIIARETA